MPEDGALLEIVAAGLVEETRAALVLAALAHLGSHSAHALPLDDVRARSELRRLLLEACDRVYERHREAIVERVIDAVFEGAQRQGR